MDATSNVIGIADEIRLSVAPVFLLTALAAFTTILTGRLARGIDRVRALTEDPVHDRPGNAAALAMVRRRLLLVQWAIRCFVIAAGVVCVVVTLIFAGDYILPDLSTAIAVLFITAMGLVILGLVLFFAEIGFSVQGGNAVDWQ